MIMVLLWEHTIITAMDMVILTVMAITDIAILMAVKIIAAVLVLRPF